MDYRLVVKRIDQDYVYSNDRTLFNVNNLWAENNEPRPDNYEEVLSRSQTKYWINEIKERKEKEIKYIDLDAWDCKWMLKASSTIGVITGKFSDLFSDELEETLRKHNHKFPTGSWFVRVERVSLKEGMHGVGPYNDLKSVIESIVSSRLGHECINSKDNLERFRIYFMPWKNIEQEFRVFVCKNKITAISTQHYFQVNDYLAKLNDSEIKTEIVDKIWIFFEDNLKEKLYGIVGPNYTMDIGILADGSVYFIEPNSFGANYAAGSALFHWYYDQDVLYSEDCTIEFRFVDRIL